MTKRAKKKSTQRMRAASPSVPPDGIVVWLAAHEKKLLWAVVSLGLALRLLHLFQIRDNDPFFSLLAVDPKIFHEWGMRLAAGDWLGQGAFFLSPLYPYFLGVIYTLVGSPDVFLARLVQMLLGSLSVLLVHAIGKRLFDVRVGLTAALLHALYVMNIFYDGMLLAAALQAPLNLLAFWLMLRAAERPAPWRFGLAGLALGLSALARPNTLLFVGVGVLWILWPLARQLARRARLVAAGAFLLGVALAVAPVTARNVIGGGDFVLVSAQSGVNLYIGNGPDATGAFVVPRIFPSTRVDDPLQQEESYRRHAEAKSGRLLRPSEVSDYWMGKAFDQVLADPGRAMGLFVKKLGLFLNALEIGNSQDFYMSRDFSWVLRLPLPSFGVVLPLALVGLGLALRRWRERFLLIGMVLIYAASLTLYFVLAHYRMPVVPFFLVLAAGAAWEGVDLARQGRKGAMVLALAGALAGAWVSQLELIDRKSGEYMIHYNLANRFRMMGQLERAVKSYEKSISLNDQYISAHNNLGLTCEQLPTGRKCAVRAWRAVRDLGRRHNDQMYVDRAEKHLQVLGDRAR